FDLDEALRAPAAIGRVQALGDNSFKSKLTGGAKYRLTITLKMFAVDDRSALCGGEQPKQFGFALDHGQARQIAAIEMKKIEDVIDEAFALPLLERRLQLRKIGNSVFIFDDNLAIDERRACGKLGNRGCDVREFFGPVETLAGEQPHLAAVEPGLGAVAVE